MNGVLSGYRVLDFGRYIAGPYCATLLAEFGADVIRIEKVAGSEDRFTTPVNGDGGVGALFMQVNRNKRGLTLNPMKPEGREIVAKLVETADVVVANLPPQGLLAMGLDLESLRKIKKDIILTTVSAYGHGGPYSDRVGFDGIGQVMSGSTYMSGSEDQPVKFAAPFVDFTTAMMSAIGTLVALMHRGKTGEGQMVEGALVRSALTIGNAALIEQALTGINRKPSINRGQTAGPTDIIQTGDGWMIVQVVGRPLFERWADMVGRPELKDDPRFTSDLDRATMARSCRRSRVNTPGAGRPWTCWPNMPPRPCRPARCTRRSRRWTTRTSRPWASCRVSSIPASTALPRSPRPPSTCQTRRAASAIAPRCWGNIPNRSSATSATAQRSLPPCATSAWSDACFTPNRSSGTGCQRKSPGHCGRGFSSSGGCPGSVSGIRSPGSEAQDQLRHDVALDLV